MTETPERGPDGNPVVRTIRRGFYEYMDTGFRLYSRFWGKNRQPDSWTLTWEYKQVDSVGSVDPVLGTLFGVNPVITDAPRRVIEAEIEHVMQHARNVLPRFPSPREWAALKDPAVDRLVGLLPSPSPSERREEIVRLARDIFLKHASGPRYYAPREIVTASEELADAILSLPAPAPTPSELVVGDRVRVHTGEEGTIDYFVPGRTKSVHVLIRPGFGGVYFPFECERLPAPAPAPVSSEGFVLVPVEPGTCELDDSGFLLAFVRELHSNAREAPVSWSDFSDEQRDRIKAAWRALIAAAPSPDQPSGSPA